MTTSNSVLIAIDKFIRDKGYPPTVREIGIGTGLKSTSSIQKEIGRLTESGFISYIPYKPRTITITEEGKGLLEKLNNRKQALGRKG